MAYLDLIDLSRRFGQQAAVRDATLRAERGEFIGLLGPSGSGKTTLLRMVAGFERPDAGRIVLDGEDITTLPPQRRRMGMVFQSYALFPNLTAAGNVAFGLRVARQPRHLVRERVEALLAMVGLAGKSGRYPHQLSGGEQQRVALARALAPNPRVLLMDEPLSALDARIRVALRQEIRRMQRQVGITALYVTHDQEEALAMSDRVMVLNAGRVEQVGTPEEIYDAPRTPFVSQFVGTVNRLSGRVTDPRGFIEVEDQRVEVATLPPGASVGDRVEIWIRPEQMALDGEATPNRLVGVVDDEMFLGARIGVHLRVGRQTLLLELPRHSAQAAPQNGQSLAVTFAADLRVTSASEENARQN